MARTVALQALEVTTRDDYAQRLKDHLKETSSHAGQVSRRIKQLGGKPRNGLDPGTRRARQSREGVSEVVAKAKAAAQGPLDAVRGSGEQEKMLRNARTEYRDEAEEIAIYTVIDSIATATGDKQTAKLARDIMRQEERMQQFLCEAELAEQHFERGRTVKQEIGHALHKHVERDGDSGDGDGEQAWMRITPGHIERAFRRIDDFYSVQGWEADPPAPEEDVEQCVEPVVALLASVGLTLEAV